MSRPQRAGLSPYRSGYISSGNLEEQNAILRTKVKKTAELEQKVELVLKHNSQLLLENEKLSKLLHQSKSEYEIMKNKFEMNSNQRAGIAANQDFEIKKLLQQNQRLKVEIAQLEHLKVTQLNDTRSQLHAELQTLKRQHLSNIELYELEIRKLKDLLERKDYELEENKNRVNRAYSESEFEIIKLREERDRLRTELAAQELQRKREADTVRSKVEVYYLSEIEAIKKTHLANLEAIEFENLRLKQSLSVKNAQIETLMSKQQKLKLGFEDSTTLLRSENELLKQKLIEYERMGQVEFENLKAKLQSVHESEIELLKSNHQNFVLCLQQEIDKLESLLNSKSLEIEQMIKERTQSRQIHESEVSRLKYEIDTLLAKAVELEKNVQAITEACQKKVEEKEEHIDYLNSLNQQQATKLNQEIQSLRKLITHKDEELETKTKQHKEIEAHLRDSLSVYTRDNQKLRDELVRAETQRTNEVQDLKESYEQQVSQLKEKLDGVTSKSELAKKEANMLKENLDMKEKESNLIKKRLNHCDDSEKKSSKEIEDLKSKLLAKDKENNKILEQQRQRLEKTFAYHLDNLKSDHANALKSEKIKIGELQAAIRKRDIDLDDLLKKYKKLEEGFYEITQQESTKKDLTLKFPGATADLIATKNLFDVFIKSKVLDLTEDIRR